MHIYKCIILLCGLLPLIFIHMLPHSLTRAIQSDVYSPDGKCASWKEWSEIAGVHSDLGSYLFNYSIYVFIALIFAGVAGLYVITLAPYASGSGIPEVHMICLIALASHCTLRG